MWLLRAGRAVEPGRRRLRRSRRDDVAQPEVTVPIKRKWSELNPGDKSRRLGAGLENKGEAREGPRCVMCTTGWVGLPWAQRQEVECGWKPTGPPWPTKRWGFMGVPGGRNVPFRIHVNI